MCLCGQLVNLFTKRESFACTRLFKYLSITTCPGIDILPHTVGTVLSITICTGNDILPHTVGTVFGYENT